MKTIKRIHELKKAVLFAGNALNKRLVVADVATDHGYLAEALSKDDGIEKVIATDISKKCLNKLVNLIEQNSLEKIETIIGDGLEPFKKADVVAIAGVGGHEIIKMLSKQNKNDDGSVKSNLFVLQPAQNVLELREWLFDNEIFVIKDYIIEDAERFYPIIIVDVSKKQLNEKNVFNLWIGRDNVTSNADFVAFLKDQLSFLEFLGDLSDDRIESDKILKDKLELKNIIDKLLK